MALAFTQTDLRRIGKVLGVKPAKNGSTWRFELPGREPSRRLSLELYPGIAIGKARGNLVSVYTHSAHLQLHFCSGYVVSEVLGEVTFIGEQGGKLSGLIIEREGGCSLFANVDRSLVSGDFTKLGPEVMLSGIALSLTDGILASPEKPSKRKTGRVRRRSKTSRA